MPFIDFGNNYDYYYLEALHERFTSNPRNLETLILGLSYGVDGIDNDALPGCYNFAMHSQDAYYDYRHVDKILSCDESNVMTCIICFGYYSLFYDLSLSTVNGFKVYNTYYPLFGDIHNLRENKEIDSIEAFHRDNPLPGQNLEKRCLAHCFFDEVGYNYYSQYKERFWWTPFETKASCYQELSEYEKDLFARHRAFQHNKYFKYTHTYMENIQILVRLFHLLRDRAVRICVCIMPFTRHYLGYISPLFKKGMIDLLDQIDVSVDFLDLNEMDVWCDEDFHNTDHLSLVGAKKSTEVLAEVLRL